MEIFRRRKMFGLIKEKEFRVIIILVWRGGINNKIRGGKSSLDVFNYEKGFKINLS